MMVFLLLVEAGGEELCLCLADGFEHKRLARIVTVGTDAEVDLVGVAIGLQCACAWGMYGRVSATVG